MLSRGALGLASPRTRRGIALSWSVLFILSLLLQYATFALAPAALAVHDGPFQLDGNAVDEGTGEDWNNHPGADAFTFVTDSVPERAFEIGDKDTDDTDEWDQGIHNVPDKDDILHAFAALYDDVIYFGADRYSNDGDAQVGFWFFKNGIGLTATGFTPVHSDGDLLVVSHFTNGGTTSTIELYQWVGSGGSEGSIDLVATGQTCTSAPAVDKACAVANSDEETSPWSYQAKDSKVDPNVFPANAFYEGGLDLAQVYDGNPPCFSSFLVETRSSQEVSATLKDFATGSFNTCAPPDIETDASESSIDLGGSVTDTATLSGDDGAVTGTVDFFVCGPNGSATACASGGTKVGGSIAIAAGSATSAAFTPTAAGWYCFRAEYNPADSSNYLAGEHTNATTECFQVKEAHIAITKTANPAGPVNAGDPIGFDITVSNEGDGTALGVEMIDELPAGVDWSVGAPSGDITGVACAITGAVGAEILTCTDASMAADDSFTVHVSAPTDANDCGTIDNTASVDTTNDGSDEASASVEVLCAQIAITKTANPAGPVNAGDAIGFDITVTNDGAGTAANVVMTDELPAGIDWTVSAATGDTTGVACAINGAVGSEVLTCTDASMAPDESFSVHVSGATEAGDCGTIDNTASVTTTNDGSDEASASVVVLCPDIEVVKDAEDAVIPAGQDLVFSITTTNIGDGVARNVVLTDDLPAGFDWAVDNTEDCDIVAGTLTCDFGAGRTSRFSSRTRRPRRPPTRAATSSATTATTRPSRSCARRC
jgi:uncharacterized repeat protein (TIGR01451 family)